MFAGNPQQSNDVHNNRSSPSQPFPSSISGSNVHKPSDDLLVLAGNGRALHSLSGPNFDLPPNFPPTFTTPVLSAAHAHGLPPSSSFPMTNGVQSSVNTSTFQLAHNLSNQPAAMPSNPTHPQLALNQLSQPPTQAHLLIKPAFSAGLNPFSDMITGPPPQQPSAKSSNAPSGGQFEPNFSAAFGQTTSNGASTGEFLQTKPFFIRWF